MARWFLAGLVVMGIAAAARPVPCLAAEGEEPGRSLRVYEPAEAPSPLDPAFDLVMEKVDGDLRYVLLSPFRITPKGAATAGMAAIVTLYLLDRDEDYLDDLSNERGHTSDKVFGRLRVLGGNVPEFTAGLYLAGYFLDSQDLKSRSLQGLEAVAITALLTGASGYLLGHASPGQSPESQEFESFSDYHSMPDMNTALTFSLASVMAYDRGWAGTLGAYAVATGVGLQRLYDREAWPSDVFIGAVLGAAIGRSVAYLSHTPDEKGATLVPYVTGGREPATGLMAQWRF